MPKQKVKKTIWTGRVWKDKGKRWVVRFGVLNPGRGRQKGGERLFRVVGEKLPFEALDWVEKQLKELRIGRNGVYIAHDSMGWARYIGRGEITGRLRNCRTGREPELSYFSFYIVEKKKHEREIETLLIRAAGPLLHFNMKKKRVDVDAGSVFDYEAGTRFFERQRRKGKEPRE